MRLELLVASPPTSKCKLLIAMFENFEKRYAGSLRVDVYYAGMQPDVIPTKGYIAEGKLKKVPSVFVNGILVASSEIPNDSDVDAVIREELKRGEAGWE
jgi:cytochrome c-type biogenesis protein CcmE